ncbi:MAG: GAF domain-containing protein, partial [Pirellulales bacterium]|nr:GAF domain-containing protein [Pirellulales bacterium]
LTMTSLAAESPQRKKRGLGSTSIAGIRASALLELGLFLAIAFIIDGIALDGDRFAGVQPHPFWIIVILLSVQYGVVEGLVGTIGATLALYLGAVPPQEFGQDLYDYILSLTGQPLLWLLTTLVLGQLRGRQAREHESLAQAFSEASVRSETIAEAYAEIEEAKNALEARLASELRTVLTMYSGARAIDRLDLGAVLAGVGELVRTVIGPRKFSLYLLNGQTLEASLNEGWDISDAYETQFGADTDLFQAIVGRQEIVSVASRAGEQVLAGQGVLAGPLYARDSGAVLGMLKIEQMAFIEFSVTAVENFRMLCDWIGSALSRAQAHETTLEQSLEGSSRNVLSASMLEKQKAFVTDLGERFRFTSSLLTITADRAHLLAEAQRSAIADAVGASVRDILRNTDMAFDDERGRRRYVVILTGTPPELAE